MFPFKRQSVAVHKKHDMGPSILVGSFQTSGCFAYVALCAAPIRSDIKTSARTLWLLSPSTNAPVKLSLIRLYFVYGRAYPCLHMFSVLALSICSRCSCASSCCCCCLTTFFTTASLSLANALHWPLWDFQFDTIHKVTVQNNNVFSRACFLAQRSTHKIMK